MRGRMYDDEDEMAMQDLLDDEELGSKLNTHNFNDLSKKTRRNKSRHQNRKFRHSDER